MAISDYAIGLATRDDVTGILDLQERNLRGVGGALSVRFSRDWFEAAISDMPIIVARSDEQVVGYVVSTPLTAQAHDPIIQAMLRAHPGSSTSYNYGPICVAEDHRGRGLAVAMFEALNQKSTFQLGTPTRTTLKHRTLFISRRQKKSLLRNRSLCQRCLSRRR